MGSLGASLRSLHEAEVSLGKEARFCVADARSGHGMTNFRGLFFNTGVHWGEQHSRVSMLLLNFHFARESEVFGPRPLRTVLAMFHVELHAA